MWQNDYTSVQAAIQVKRAFTELIPTICRDLKSIPESIKSSLESDFVFLKGVWLILRNSEILSKN